MKLDSLEEVLADVRAGKPIVMIDDHDRENEGDLMVAAEKVTAESINFMLKEGKGLICISLLQAQLERIGVPMQAVENSSAFGTNFAVSFDLAGLGPEAITAEGRARTILAASSESSRPHDFCMPGFVFPVAAVSGGVLKRRGQTEGSVDLSVMAGLGPAGVICEVMGADGVMLRGDDLLRYCKKHDLKITSVEEIVKRRLHEETSIRKVLSRDLNKEGDFLRNPQIAKALESAGDVLLQVVLYVDDVDESEHFAIVVGEPKDDCLVRIHSECLTGDVFGSARCDCGDQFDRSLAMILEAGEGVLVYLHQEGRGIGLANKLRAYELQESGLDTVDANVHLGFQADERDYRVGAKMLTELGLSSVRLMTNNPQKLHALRDFGLNVSERIELPVCIGEHNAEYMETKKKRMGHIFENGTENEVE